MARNVRGVGESAVFVHGGGMKTKTAEHYLAHLWMTLYENNYLTKEFENEYPQIIESANSIAQAVINEQDDELEVK